MINFIYSNHPSVKQLICTGKCTRLEDDLPVLSDPIPNDPDCPGLSQIAKAVHADAWLKPGYRK